MSAADPDLYGEAQAALAAGRFADAAALLERALALEPGGADMLTDLGHCRFQLGLAPEALQAFDAALAADPGHLGALCNRAATLVALGDRPGGTAAYEAASLAHPGRAEPLVALAALAVQSGDADRARDFASRALALDPGQARAALALAEADLLARAFAPAERQLRTLIESPGLSRQDRNRAVTLLGDALDGEDRVAEAFAAYRRAGETAPAAPADPAAETPAQLVAGLTRYFERAPAEPWRAAPGPDAVGARAARGHVFLLGFPRSGTTLIDQALASHPAVASLEETEALAEASADWMGGDAALDRLAAITPAQADAARESYWRAAAALTDLGDGRKVLVDKAPLHTLRLPLIAKLFPEAKLLLARRDPRDVVFSCFRRRIRLGASMDEFATPERAADYYGAVMRLAELYAGLLPLNLRVVKHEDLVVDFQGQMAALLRFIGLDWDPAVQSFAQRARSNSKTPSAAQLARGLNADGIGQWRRYAAQLAPVLAALEPWVEAFGYERETPAAPAADAAQREAATAAALAEIQQALGAGAFARAFDVAEAALARGLEGPLLYKLRALKREQQGRPDLAVADFERAVRDAPDDYATLNALGLCLAKAGRPAEGLARLDAALRIAPDYAPAHYNRGWTLESAGDLVGARGAYARAVELDGGHAQALANLAALATRAAAWDEAAGLARRALSLDPAHPTAAIAMAQVELAQDQAEAAERRLRALVADPRRTPPHDRSVALTLLGDTLDRLQRPRDAMAAYAQANAGLRALNAPRFAAPGVETGLALAERLAAETAALGPAPRRRASPPGPCASHVFVVGFPRSGTTLLGQVLQSHGGVVTLDERETLAEAGGDFLRPGGLAKLWAAGDDVLAAHRQLYWRRVAEAGVDPAGKLFVDKLPMNTLGLPLVARLFPAAKVVFVRRDPRDVVLSAFRRQFALNAATWELLTLPGAARFYDAVMRLFELYAERLDLDLRIQRYEALTTDFDGEVRALADFLGIDWPLAAGDFAAASRAGRIATPSAAQIARGLYTEGAGQWRSYRDALAPVLPTLAPWVAEFGYPAD